MIKKANYLTSQGKEVKPQCELVEVFTPEEIELLRAEAFKRYGNGKPMYRQSAAFFLILGHTTSEVTEMYYIKKDNTKLEGMTDVFNL